jgi:hypothetical protein
MHAGRHAAHGLRIVDKFGHFDTVVINTENVAILQLNLTPRSSGMSFNTTRVTLPRLVTRHSPWRQREQWPADERWCGHCPATPDCYPYRAQWCRPGHKNHSCFAAADDRVS